MMRSLSLTIRKALFISLLFIIQSTLVAPWCFATSIPTDVLPAIPKVKDFTEQTVGAGQQIGQTSTKLFYDAPKQIVDTVFQVFAAISGIIVVYAGIKIIFSRGTDPKKFKEGIMAIIYAGIGLVIIGGAWIIVRLVLNINFS